MNTSRIVVLKNQIGFGIYDTVEESFIGLLQKRGAGIAKSVWTKSGYAKSAFKEHTGVYFGEQDRYIIKEIK